ncbi:ankyrin repeat domain-containing protein [Aliagarivorans marinus]|uniref:ankyrin repeat domain-containing protein n=1 Tax=Aliagarivorans marinus TaxID=561965 RepID=UPI00146FC06C|nr:ankyrin repeat domain-containing protein [Aliagarivorans marinus]
MDPDRLYSLGDQFGLSPRLQGLYSDTGSLLHFIARFSNNPALIDVVLDAGADIERYSRYSLRPHSPLVAAAIAGNLTIAQHLIAKGADSDKLAELLHYYFDKKTLQDNLDVVENVLEIGVPLDFVHAGSWGPNSRSLLSRSLRYKDYDLTGKLLEHGASFEPGNGHSILYTAQQYESKYVAQLYHAGARLSPDDPAGSLYNQINSPMEGVDPAWFLTPDTANYRSDYGTALALAFAKQHPLLDDILALADHEALRALYAAVLYGDEQRALKLLETTTDVNQESRQNGHDLNGAQHLWGDTPLMAATKNNNYRLAKALLAAGADPNHANGYGLAPLHHSVSAEDSAVTQLLLAHGADPNIIEYTERGTGRRLQPANYASEANLRLLLAAGAELNPVDHDSALIGEVRYGDEVFIRRLVNAGANVNHIVSSSRSPLRVAIENNDMDKVKLLIELGADLNLQNEQEHTPAISAIHKVTSSTLQQLFELGLDPHLVGRWGLPLIAELALNNDTNLLRETLQQFPEQLDLADDKGQTPLALALLNGRYEQAQILLQAGADVNVRNHKHSSLLDMSLSARRNHSQMWTLLHQYGYDFMQAHDEHANSYQYLLAEESDLLTAWLFGAFSSKRSELLKQAWPALKQRQAENDSDDPLNKLWQRMFKRSLSGEGKKLSLLIELGLDPNTRMPEPSSRSDQGPQESLLHHLLRQRCNNTIPLATLLEAGASLTATNHQRQTPLVFASEKSYRCAEHVAALLEAGADPTPIMNDMPLLKQVYQLQPALREPIDLHRKRYANTLYRWYYNAVYVHPTDSALMLGFIIFLIIFGIYIRGGDSKATPKD